MSYYKNDNRKKNRSLQFQNSEDGLTNVITTVLIITIIMTFIIGPYLTVMVPQQIKNNEAAHLDDIKESFLDLKSAINMELHEEAPILTTPIKLGTNDENLFVLGGSGALYFDSSEPIISIASYYDPQSIFARGSGNIRYKSRNLYLRDKHFIYESSGVIVQQRDKARMNIEPDFELTRGEVITSIGLECGFVSLGAGDTVLNNIYISNTGTTDVTYNRLCVTWIGGNATTMTRCNIGVNPVEWTGSAASGITVDFQNNYDLLRGSVPMSLRFDSDIREAILNIELFSTDARSISTRYPVIDLDTVANIYDITFPDFQTVDNISFKNICGHTVTIKRMALSWTGGATLTQVDILGHGETVWQTAAPGKTSPIYFNLNTASIFDPTETGDIKLYFTGNILNENINIKFFAENSSNSATTKYPLDLNETYINASFSMITLISDKINISGKSTKMIKTTLISTEENRYIWETGENIILNITTKYGDAWVEYLNNTLVENADLTWDFDGLGAFPGDYYITTNQISDEIMNINLILNSIYKLECTIGVIEAGLG